MRQVTLLCNITQLLLTQTICVFRHILTSISISGTSIRTPTTVASAAPDESPKSMVELGIEIAHTQSGGIAHDW